MYLFGLTGRIRTCTVPPSSVAPLPIGLQSNANNHPHSDYHGPVGEPPPCDFRLVRP